MIDRFSVLGLPSPRESEGMNLDEMGESADYLGNRPVRARMSFVVSSSSFVEDLQTLNSPKLSLATSHSSSLWALRDLKTTPTCQ